MAQFSLDVGAFSTKLKIGREPVVVSPSLAAYDLERGVVTAIGKEALDTALKTGSRAKLFRLMDGGAPAEPRVLSGYLKALLKSVGIKSFGRAPVTVATTGGASDLDVKSLLAAVEEAGGKRCVPVSSVIAATVGVHEDPSQEQGVMALIVGESVVEAGIVSFGKVAAISSARGGVRALRSSVRESVKATAEIVVSDDVAAEILGEMIDLEQPNRGTLAQVWGRSQENGEHASSTVSERDLMPSLLRDVDAIAAVAATCISRARAQLVSDVAYRGIYLLGGGARLNGLAAYLSNALSVSVKLPPEPELAIIEGLAGLASSTTVDIYW